MAPHIVDLAVSSWLAMMNLSSWEGFKKYDILGANFNADF